ncbi:hypothetical protein TNCV_4974091 [Trichonephila clavipes]|uniref:Uncharacterized protein n=1 Tax=Trichonephila clavipes TaxID=2585209 RepID=A0A8X6SE44_TRICX|nr:hypothetical protein TNCV_4974091 [Trichonephila clavipes]
MQYYCVLGVDFKMAMKISLDFDQGTLGIRKLRLQHGWMSRWKLISPAQIWSKVKSSSDMHCLGAFGGFFGDAAIRDISRSCLDPNDFTVLNFIVKGHASLSLPSLRLRLCSRFTLLATYTYFDL